MLSDLKQHVTFQHLPAIIELSSTYQTLNAGLVFRIGFFFFLYFVPHSEGSQLHRYGTEPLIKRKEIAQEAEIRCHDFTALLAIGFVTTGT